MADNNVFVQWQNTYSVGIRLVDEQHMELIKLTNKLFLSCMASKEKTKDAFIDTVREAVDYVGYHFSTEEKIMDRINYPDYTIHKREHADFVREVFNKVEEFKEEQLLILLKKRVLLKMQLRFGYSTPAWKIEKRGVRL